MDDLWWILLVLLVPGAVIARQLLTRGTEPASPVDIEPTSPPAGPDAEGMAVVGPGDIAPGVPDDEPDRS